MTVESNTPTDKKIYEKSQSFDSFISMLNTDVEAQKQRAIRLLEDFLEQNPENEHSAVLSKAHTGLTTADAIFKITTPIADEMSRIDDENIPRYLFHRYRYDIFPKEKILDGYPPYLQIEPTSVCNYRCVFCYQTDKSFTDKKSGHMGSMTFETFKKIIDQVEGKIEFFSLASRGEPLICREIDDMLSYCKDKFLGLKINTNASLLTEEKCHAILSGGVNTLVFSADAAEEPLYSQLRVNGKLDKVLKNIDQFHNIKNKHYPHSKLITRVSGVKFKTEQSMSAMTDVWGPLVDQVCFVDYNPWENVYTSAITDVSTPCSDLWRRMFVWFDGKVNPCDTDFKSELAMGNILENSITDLWRSEGYERLRENHLENRRGRVNPCQKCTVI